MRISQRIAFAVLVLAPGLFTVATHVARADVFGMSGTFGTGPFTGPLNGGTFSGTFSVTGFPFSSGQVVTISTFDVFLRDSSNTLLAEIDSADAGAKGNVDTRSDATAGDILNFNFAPSDSNFIEIQVVAGFSGTGPIIPLSSHLDGFSSFAGIGSNTFVTDSAIASGRIFRVGSQTPEPASLLLLASGLLGLAFAIQRKLFC